MGILFTRIWRLFNHQGEGLKPRAYGWGRGSAPHGSRVGVCEYFRSVGVVARSLRGVLGAGMRASVVQSQSQLGDGSRLAALCFKDLPKKSIPKIHPLAPISVGNGKDLSDVPQWHSLAYFQPFFLQQLGLHNVEKSWGSLG